MKRGQRALGKRVVEALVAQMAESGAPTNSVTPVFYTIFGVLMLAMTGGLGWMVLQLR